MAELGGHPKMAERSMSSPKRTASDLARKTRRSMSALSSQSMRIKAQETRKSFTRPRVWVLAFGWFLATCAGMVNTISFRNWGLYVSHMTGTSTALGSRLEGFHNDKHDDDIVIQALLLVLSFVAGSFACGLLIDKNQVHFGGKSFYGVALVGNALLLVGAVVLHQPDASSCMAAAACGLQNAMCTSHFGAVVRTTHVTGTLTDIGSTLGRVAMIFLRRGCRRSRLNILEEAEVGVDLRKLLVLLPMWLFFVLGSMIGGFLEHGLGIWALLVPAGFTLSLGLAYSFLRTLLKETIKRFEEENLSQKIREVQFAFARTGSRLAEQQSKNLQDIDEQMGEMMEMLSEVDASVTNLCESPRAYVEEEEQEEEEEEEGRGSRLRL